MTFVGHIVYMCRAQMMLLGPSKSHVIVLSTKLCRLPGKYNTFCGQNLFLKINLLGKGLLRLMSSCSCNVHSTENSEDNRAHGGRTNYILHLAGSSATTKFHGLRNAKNWCLPLFFKERPESNSGNALCPTGRVNFASN